MNLCEVIAAVWSARQRIRSAERDLAASSAPDAIVQLRASIRDAKRMQETNAGALLQWLRHEASRNFERDDIAQVVAIRVITNPPETLVARVGEGNDPAARGYLQAMLGNKANDARRRTSREVQSSVGNEEVEAKEPAGREADGGPRTPLQETLLAERRRRLGALLGRIHDAISADLRRDFRDGHDLALEQIADIEFFDRAVTKIAEEQLGPMADNPAEFLKAQQRIWTSHVRYRSRMRERALDMARARELSPDERDLLVSLGVLGRAAVRPDDGGAS